MLREGDLYAPGNIQGTLACDCSIMWTAGECFAVIFAMRGPSICTFGHLFVDAEPEAIERLWSGFDEPEKSHVDVEMLLHGYLHESTVKRSVARTFFLAFTSLLILLAMQHFQGVTHAPKKSCTCHPRFPTHSAGQNALIASGWRIPMH
jgi:hypothetical protein